MIQVIKELIDRFFLVIISQQATIKFLFNISKNIFFWEIENCNIEIDQRNDQTINETIKQYNKVRKVSRRQSDDYTTGSFLEFAYFEKKIKLIVSNLIKQKTLDVDPRAIQQIIYKTNSSKYKSKWLNTVR